MNRRALVIGTNIHVALAAALLAGKDVVLVGVDDAPDGFDIKTAVAAIKSREVVMEPHVAGLRRRSKGDRKGRRADRWR